MVKRKNYCPGTLRVSRNGTHAFARCSCGHSIVQTIDAPSFPEATYIEIQDHFGCVPIFARTLVTFKKPTLPFVTDQAIGIAI